MVEIKEYLSAFKPITKYGWIILIFYFNSGYQQENSSHTTQNKSWPEYGGSPDQSKYFEQDQITRENVDQLQVAWTYPTADNRAYQVNPLIIDTIAYLLAKNNSLVALDARNGKELWIHADLRGISSRGFSYWESEDRTDRRLIFTLGNSLQAIDARTGKSIKHFGNNGVVDLRQGLGRNPKSIRRIASNTPGKIFDNLLILGSAPGENYFSAPGHIRAYDVRTGEMAWIFHTIPHPGEYGYETWPKEAYRYAGGVNCWSEISIDKKNGIAFIPLGSPTYDFYGGDRLGNNLFGNCLLALDARMGKRIWHFQTVHHDLWDYDLSSAPQLITVDHNGRKVGAVAIATKQGFLFVFDRLTGKPLWEIEELPVPASEVPGEKASATQPFPTVLPPFGRQTADQENVSRIFLSEEEYTQMYSRVKKATKGLYVPPSLSESIAVAGASNGANWGNTAAYPERGLVFVMNSNYPSFYRLQTNRSRNTDRPVGNNRLAIQRGQVVFVKHCQTCHGEDLAGTVLAPSLLGINNRINRTNLDQIIRFGLGRMPAIQHIEDNEIDDVLAFLKARSSSNNKKQQESLKERPTGPVVASGGVPRTAQILDSLANVSQHKSDGEDYHPDIPLYHTDYGLGYPYLFDPPWASITAYDLNQGSIKWSRPLGEEKHAMAKGFSNTGVPSGSQRNSMIVTSNGLLFTTVNNGQLFIYDLENGQILWKKQLEMGIAGLSSMYEIAGQVYIMVNATTPLPPSWGLNQEEKRAFSAQSSKAGAYVVFRLGN